jgi:hypothetical protein
MRRRDISGLFLGSAAGSMLLPANSNAQVCAPPCHELIRPAEVGIIPIKNGFPPLDVRRYGAVLDGKADDTQALRNAITVAARLGGAEILVPFGTLRLTATVTMNLRTSLKGVGKKSSKILVDFAGWGLTLSSGEHLNRNLSDAHIRIESIGFVGTPAAIGALHFSKVNYLLVRDCAFERFFGDAKTVRGVGIQMTECFIWGVEHCHFEDIGLVGLNLAGDEYGCNHGVFGPNNEVIGNSRATFTGISIDTAQNVVITSNDFEGSGNGGKAIELRGSEGIWICGNYMEKWKKAAIAANAGEGNKRVFIMENAIHAESSNICDFNNSAKPNENVVVALNRFIDARASQTCVLVGTTHTFCEFNNDPNLGRITEVYSPSSITARALEKSLGWNFQAIASGAAGAVVVDVPGAVVGDVCVASFDQIAAKDFLISAHVSAADTVRVVLMNKEATTVNFPPGTLRVKVFK